MPHPTIYDVARQARVSIATVSRALQPSTRALVASATRARIAHVVQRLGYAPNAAARGLSGAASGVIGVLLPHRAGVFASQYYADILTGAADALLEEASYRLKPVLLPTARATWDAHPFRAAEGVDALVIPHWRAFFAQAASLRRLGLPCVLISDVVQGAEACCAGADHALGGALVAEHLYARGHRRIAVITGPPHSTDSRLRVEGFVRALRRHRVRVPSAWIVEGEFHEAPTVPRALALLRDAHRRPTAVFCCNDLMAFGVLQACAQLRLRCPRDLSLVGYDDHPRSVVTAPPLTTVRVPVADLAREAVGRLLARLRGGPRAAFVQPMIAPVALVERGSVRDV